MKKYKAKFLEEKKNDKGWSFSLIGVFDGDEKVSEYIRNYNSFYNTFDCFKRDEQWYALYSDKYTEVSIAKLPEMEKISSTKYPVFGEKNEGYFNSVCPVDFYVPCYKWLIYKNGEKEKCYFDSTYKTEKEFDKTWTSNNVWELDNDLHYEKFAFMAGCIWGDDSSMKVCVVDLKDLNNVRVYKESPIHYKLHLSDMLLKDSIEIDGTFCTIKTKQFIHIEDDLDNWELLS